MTDSVIIEEITNPAPAAVTFATICTDSGNVVVPCEPINEHLAITPSFAMDDDGKTIFSGAFRITHLPTGRNFADGEACIHCCRRAGDRLAALGLDYASVNEANGTEWVAALSDDAKAELAVIRAVDWACEAEYCDDNEDD